MLRLGVRGDAIDVIVEKDIVIADLIRVVEQVINIIAVLVHVHQRQLGRRRLDQPIRQCRKIVARMQVEDAAQ